MNLMLNFSEGHGFVELNYPHLIAMQAMNGITVWRVGQGHHTAF
jgi:seryl-tRNA synthetase